MRRIGLAVVLAVSFFLTPILVGGQQCCKGEVLRPEFSIPREQAGVRFGSWSLFLVCNPAWLLKENQDRLHDLRLQFAAFSEAIGPKHLAVWFSKQEAESVDADRSSLYCEKFRLLPSEGPHVFVTTTYPDLDEPALNHYVILKLNGLNAPDTTSLLTKLADQLLIQGLQQADLDSERWWRAWQRSFEVTRTKLAAFTKKVRVSIHTKFCDAEIEGGR